MHHQPSGLMQLHELLVHPPGTIGSTMATKNIGMVKNKLLTYRLRQYANSAPWSLLLRC